MSSEDQEMMMEQLMDNYKFPQNVGKLKDFTLFRHQKNPSCGDAFDLFVKVDKGEIKDVKYSGDGCAISTASFSLLSQKLIGMNYEKAKKLTDKDIYDMIGVNISPGRINCAMLSLNAFLEASKENDKN